MVETKSQSKYPVLSVWVIASGLLYIFAYQFRMPFPADTFLYSMLFGLAVMAVFNGYINITVQAVMFVVIDAVAFIGLLNTSQPDAGLREAILFLFFTGLFVLSEINPFLVKSFVKYIYYVSIIVIFTSIIHFLFPIWFNDFIKLILRDDAFETLMHSFEIDNAFPGIAAYTPNTSFSAAIVFGHSFIHLIDREETPIIKSKSLNVVLMIISMFSIILCSKRGLFVSVIIAAVILLFYFYRGRNFIVKMFGILIASALILTVLYRTNDAVYVFLNRFISDDFLTGRESIYRSLLDDLMEGNVFFGRGTASTYEIGQTGAHNIYIQLLYDHGILFSIPYFIFFIYNYYVSFKNKCSISIFLQTVFLVYGLVGNPLYSNMFMIMYVYYVLYSNIKPGLDEYDSEAQEIKINPKHSAYLYNRKV